MNYMQVYMRHFPKHYSDFDKDQLVYVKKIGWGNVKKLEGRMMTIQLHKGGDIQIHLTNTTMGDCMFFNMEEKPYKT